MKEVESATKDTNAHWAQAQVKEVGYAQAAFTAKGAKTRQSVKEGTIAS